MVDINGKYPITVIRIGVANATTSRMMLWKVSSQSTLIFQITASLTHIWSASTLLAQNVAERHV